MNLAQLLTRLARGPIGDLSIGGGSTGVIPADKVSSLVEKAQSALTELYTRFPLSLKTITLVTVDGLFEYPLRVDFAQTSGSAEVNKFIQDSVVKPFTGDVLAIQHVYDADMCELGLNDRNDCTSWFTPGYDVLSMDYPTEGTIYFIEYRADHAVLDPTPAELANQSIRIPIVLEEALLTKIAYEVFCSQTGESAAIKAQELLGKYNSICMEIEGRNAVNSSVVDIRDDRIKNGGWS